jgi:hypothetical protein
MLVAKPLQIALAILPTCPERHDVIDLIRCTDAPLLRALDTERMITQELTIARLQSSTS